MGRSPLFRQFALLAGLSLLAACAQGTDAADTVPMAASSAPATTEQATTTTERATTTTEEATTTTEPPEPVYPLTGLPAPDPLTALRPVVVAKVGNYDSAPPTGLNVADIVFEELINDNVSRFAIVFHSRFPDDAVGPIRSGRLQDVNLLGSLNQPILAWSGGNGTVTRAIDDSDLVNLSPNYCRNACFRVDFAQAPYNLYYDIARAYDVGVTLGAGNPDQLQFQYREPGERLSGTPSSGVKVAMDSYDTEWTWNPATELYERSQNGRVHDERSGELITTDNVVVLAMAYFPGVSGSPDAQSVGYGEAWVFSAGTMVHGVWSRSDRTEPFTLTTDDGAPILLTPGRTFVQLPRDEPGLIEVKPA